VLLLLAIFHFWVAIKHYMFCITSQSACIFWKWSLINDAIVTKEVSTNASGIQILKKSGRPNGSTSENMRA
jgi:hypothetical protein